jgi:hypothetical protein
MKKIGLMVSLALSLGAIGCQTEAPAPDKPTWVDDVLPILQANCFHCHGANAKQKAGNSFRWDVLDLTNPRYADIGFGEAYDPPGDALKGAKVFVSANNPLHYATVPLFTLPTMTDDARMPPPPATKLSDRDIAVLQNWAGNGFAPGSHQPNHKPTIAWLTKNKTFAVVDADGDQVLGKLMCGDAEVSIPRSGLHTLPAGVTGPCDGNLFDGWGDELTAVSLK